MTALLNLVVPVVIFVFMALAYRDWNKNKIKLRLATHYLIPLICILYIYQVFQPSYIPKNSVQKMKREPVIFTEIKTENRLRSPIRNEVESEERFNSIMDHREEINKILNN